METAISITRLLDTSIEAIEQRRPRSDLICRDKETNYLEPVNTELIQERQKIETDEGS